MSSNIKKYSWLPLCIIEKIDLVDIDSLIGEDKLPIYDNNTICDVSLEHSEYGFSRVSYNLSLIGYAKDIHVIDGDVLRATEVDMFGDKYTDNLTSLTYKVLAGELTPIYQQPIKTTSAELVGKTKILGFMLNTEEL